MITITRLLALDGPHLRSPYPGVVLQISADADYRQVVILRLKDAAQRVGVVLAALDAALIPAPSGYMLELSFTTPTPALGAAITRFVIEALQAEERGDADWDADQRLFDLQQQRREQALPISFLQRIADAHARSIPTFLRDDGALQIGYGARGVALAMPSPNLDPLSIAAIGVRGIIAPGGEAPEPEWQRLGTIPLIALSGQPPQCSAVCDAWQKIVSAHSSGAQRWGLATRIVPHADFTQVRRVLADASTSALIVGLQPASVAERGLPFPTCDACAILGLPEIELDDMQRVQLAGLPLLVTPPAGVAVLNADIPALSALTAYARCRLVWYSRQEPRILQLVRPSSDGITLRGQQIWALSETAAEMLGDLLPDVDVDAQLAAWALAWGLRPRGSDL